jgi:arginine decarboxylase-like protein
MMRFAQYDCTQLTESYRRQLATQVQAGKMSESTASELIEQYRSMSTKSTYLD